MKLSIFETPANFAMSHQAAVKSSKGNGLFGEILQLKMQTDEGAPKNSSEGLNESSGLIGLIGDALTSLKQLLEDGNSSLDDDVKELLQTAVDLLERMKDAKVEDASQSVEEALDGIILTANQILADSQNEHDFDRLQEVLKELTAEAIGNTASFQQKNEELPLHTLPGYFVRPIVTTKTEDSATDEQLVNAKHAEGRQMKSETGEFSKQPVNLENEDDLQPAIRLQQAEVKGSADGKALLMEGNDQKAPQEGSVQTKPITSGGQAANLNSAAETEEVIVRLAGNASNERLAKELIRQFTSVLQKSHFNRALQTKSLTIRLYPEHLGSLRIELTQRDGAMIARILASTSMAKDILDSQIHQLRQAFVQQNIQVDKVDISYQEGLDKYSSQDQRSNDQEKPGSDQGSNKEAFSGEKDEEEFSRFLQKVLFEMEV